MFQRMMRRVRTGESGVALITTILVMVIVTGMGAIVVEVATTNIRNAGRDRASGGALGAAEAGLAAGATYIQGTAGVSSLTCSPNCATNPWGNKASPQTVTVAGNRSAKVWIQVVQAINPPAVKSAQYIIHSVGTAGAAGTTAGSVELEQEVSAKPFSFPIGVYADWVGAAGNASVHKESFFTQGCVNMRSHMTFEGIDQWYGIPAGVHSTKWITDSNNNCSANDNKNIHKAGSPGVCNTSYPYDQDALGGDLTSTPCYGNPYPLTSYFDAAGLQSSYGQQARGLTTAQYAALKSRAQAMGQYYTTTSYTAPDPATYPNAVMYFKVPAGQTVMIQNQLNAYSSATCGSRSLVIVIEGGGLHVNAGADITAAIFVPDGTYTGNGNNKIYGTLFASKIDKFNGTADFYLDPCFFANMPGGLLSVTPMRFRVVDR
jgi:Tfp pilus assembly protein PilX